MGVNTDGEKTNTETRVRDNTEHTPEIWQIKQDSRSGKSMSLKADYTGRTQDLKLVDVTDTLLFTPEQKKPSQKTSEFIFNIEEIDPQKENTDREDKFLSRQSNRQKEILHSVPVCFTAISCTSDDKCSQLKDCRLQPFELNKIMDRDKIDALEDPTYNTLLAEISSRDTNGPTHELPLNPHIDKVDDNGYTALYKVALEGKLNEVVDVISKGANIDKPSKGGLRPLHAAAKEGHADIVYYLILHGADPGVECDMGQTPLHTAAVNGHTCIIEILIAEAVDVNKEDDEGRTPFNASVEQGHLDALKYLIDKGAEQNRYDGMTPLYAAASFGHLDIVKFFISNGADVNEVDDHGQVPLHSAAFSGNMKIMEYLIHQGSDVNKADNNGWTPFNAAIQNGLLEVVKYLMDKGAEQNRYAGMTPLYAAAEFGRSDIVEFFISNGADVNEENDDGRIPLHGAAFSGNMKIMEYLFLHGSDLNKADKEGGTPFNAAIQYGHLEAVKYLIDKGAKQNRCIGMTPLYAAAAFGHLDIVRFFISNGADVNEENNNGFIPLHEAGCEDKVEIMEYLIQHGSDVNKAGPYGLTPFHVAIACGNLSAVKYLLDKGAKQNRYDGMTPLYVAAQFGHLDIAEFFISNGADMNEENDNGRIPLHEAAVKGDMKILEYFIQKGSDVNKADPKGWAPFNSAIEGGHLEAVEYLLDKGAKQNRYNGMTPLYAAAKFGHLDIVEFFISNGADVNEENDDGGIPLHGAAARDHVEVIEYLIKKGSDVNREDEDGGKPFHEALKNGQLEAVKHLLRNGAIQERYDGMTPLYIAVQAGHLDIVRFLVSNGACVNEVDDEGMIALHAAARNGNIEIVKHLIEEGSDVNKAGNNGLTPLNAAIIVGHLEVFKFLIAEGANYFSYESMTPLYIATQYDHIEIVKFLVSEGYNVNEGTERGKSPLHAACYNGNIDMVDFLLLNNADVNKQDQDGWTPFHAAAQEGHQQIIKYLSLRAANMKDMDVITSIMASPNKVPSTRRIKESLSTDVFAQISTRDQQYKSHKNAITAEDATAPSADPQTQSCLKHTEQSKLKVHSIHDDNAFIHAEIDKESWDRQSLKAFPKWTHHHEDDTNGERTPFFGAQPKSPDKPGRDPTQNHMEAIDDIMITKLNNQTNNIGFPNSSGPQTWQYSGFDPPFLQTQNNSKTSGKISEDPKSRWRLLTEEIGQTRKPQNERVNHGAASESNRTQRSETSLIGHQNVDYKKQLSNIEAILTNTGWKIFSKHRSGWTSRPPSLLQILQTFIQMLLALAILLSGCPIHVAGSGLTEEVTLIAGSRGVVQFHIPSSLNDTFQDVPNYVFRFESQDRPFCTNGVPDADGFKNQGQLSRFTTNVVDLDTSPCVNLIIDNVETVDQDWYIFQTIFFHGVENVQLETVKKNIVVQLPHGPAKCFITVSDEDDDEFPYEVHCRASSGSSATSLSCFQNGQKLHSRNGIADDGQVTRGIFFLPLITRFACCSHEVASFVHAATCSDFEWPPRKPFADTTTRSAGTLPKSENTTSDSPLNIATSTNTHMKDAADSAARRPFIYQSLLYLSLWSFFSMHALSVVYQT